MKKYSKVVQIPTGDFRYEKIGVEFDFDDDKKPVDAWFEVDEAIKFQKKLIEQEIEMNSHFQTKPKVPTPTMAVAPAYTPSSPPVIVQATATTEAKMCPIHNVPLENRVSKKPPFKPYTGHSISAGVMCFGRKNDFSI